MWTPRQLLTDEVVLALRRSQLFTEPLIEFLGWNHGRAARINRNLNPVKCAQTMFRDTDDNAKTHEWLAAFFDRKRNSVRPKAQVSTSIADKMAWQFEQFMEDFETAEEAQAKEVDVEQDALDNE